MQIYRLNKSSELTTRAIIISHMDLDGVMSAYLCDRAYRGCTGYTKEQVQVVGEYSPEPRATLACLKQVLYKLKTDEELSIFILDRSNISPEEINKLVADGWIQPRWKITCIDHHNTNFKQEDYERTIVRVNQIVDDKNSAAMNVLNFFSQFGYEFDDKIKEITRLASIYDRFAWLSEEITKEDELKAKYLNRVCGINHRNEFLDMVENYPLNYLLETGEAASNVISMMVKKIYRELSEDRNDFLVHCFKNGSGESLNILFIRKNIEYLYVSELSELIFDENEDIHVLAYIDSNLGSLSLRSRESGKYVNISDMISSLKLNGGGHPGAGGYFAHKSCDKKELINKIYSDQSHLMVNFINDMIEYINYNNDLRGFKYSSGDTFYGMDESCKNYLESISLYENE